MFLLLGLEELHSRPEKAVFPIWQLFDPALDETLQWHLSAWSRINECFFSPMITFCSSGQVFLLLPHYLYFPPDQLWWLAHRHFNENPRSFTYTCFLCCKSASPLILYLLFLFPLFSSFPCLSYDFLHNAIHCPRDPGYFHCPFPFLWSKLLFFTSWCAFQFLLFISPPW